jgi:hypothetical protein
MRGSLAPGSGDGRQRRPESERLAQLGFDFHRRSTRPGLYRFEDGRLSEIDRVEQPQSPQPEDKKPAKKKPAAIAVPPKTGDKS